MTIELFTKLESKIKPAWNDLTVEERKAVNRTASRFEEWNNAARGPDYDPGASPYTMNPELQLRDALVYFFRMTVTAGLRLKEFKSLPSRDRAVVTLFKY